MMIQPAYLEEKDVINALMSIKRKLEIVLNGVMLFRNWRRSPDL